MSSQFFLELFRAITVAAGPRFCFILVTAIAAGVRIFHAHQFEILFPVRTLFRERRIAKASLDPGRHSVFVYPGLLHVVQVFITCDGASSKGVVFDCAQKREFISGFNVGFYEITHDAR